MPGRDAKRPKGREFGRPLTTTRCNRLIIGSARRTGLRISPISDLARSFGCRSQTWARQARKGRKQNEYMQIQCVRHCVRQKKSRHIGDSKLLIRFMSRGGLEPPTRWLKVVSKRVAVYHPVPESATYVLPYPLRPTGFHSVCCHGCCQRIWLW